MTYIGCNLNQKDKLKLKSLELYTEKTETQTYDRYFLKAVYEHTTNYIKELIIIPKIKLNVNPFNLILNRATCNTQDSVDIGFGDCDLLEKDGFSYIVKILEEYPQKMTLEEIEKKLGYKVEVVSKK